MRQGPLSLLLVLNVVTPLHAQETASDPTTGRGVELEQRATESEQPHAEMNERLSPVNAEAQNTQLARLRVENQRLQRQLQEAQARTEPPLLNDQQQWFAVGGSVGVLGFLLGVLTARGRRRRQWLN